MSLSVEYNARSSRRIASALIALRRERGLTQAEVAADAGVSRQWLVAAEQGDLDSREIGRLLQVLESLGASIIIRPSAMP